MKPHHPAVLLFIALFSACTAAAETHRFVPDRFYGTYSAAHPPALRVKPGDTVVTKTIDAAGVDWNGKSVAQGPNPQTGPFYVEGAAAGDVLVVTFLKIETNRTMAYSASLLAPYAVDPTAIAARTDREAKRLTWTIDRAKNVARLDQSDVQAGGIELPLRPMLGCVGVAPARKEAISTATPGPFGGNMDYAWLNAGAKV
ncbi:MAG TPA: acetamidase/formamidase family protein, partial [Vicinamibacterales bacterium]